MASSNRKIIKKLYTKLAKRYTEHSDSLDKSREVLEHLIYATFLENASFEVANLCFSVLESYFVDWNEVRVSTARELGEVFNTVYEPERTGERIRRTLQYIFETLYKFDLEEFRARGPIETMEYLQSIPYSTDFINAYTVNAVFKMQDIPLDEGSLRALRLLDLIEVNDKNREDVEGLANAFTQNERLEFFQCLHALGLEMLDDSRRPDAIEFLKEIDSKADQRSWTPIVDLSEITDPVLIARQLSRKEHKPKMPIALALEDEGDIEIIDDAIEEDLLVPSDDSVEEVEVYLEVETSSRNDLSDSIDYCEEEPERKKSRSATMQDKTGLDKGSQVPAPKKSGAKKSGTPTVSASKGDVSKEASTKDAPAPSAKASSSKSRTPQESPSKGESVVKKSGSKPSVTSDKKKSGTPEKKKTGTPDKKGKESKIATAGVSSGTNKSSNKESREKQPVAKKAGKSAAGPVKQEPAVSVNKVAGTKKESSAKTPAKTEKAPVRKEKAKSTLRPEKTKKAPVKSDETKKESAKKGGAKGDGAKKDGPKQVADKNKKVSAAKKLLQNKPH